MNSFLSASHKQTGQANNNQLIEGILDLSKNLPQFGKQLRLYNRNEQENETYINLNDNRKNKFSSTASNSFNKFQSCCEVRNKNQDNDKFKTMKKLSTHIETEALYTDVSLQTSELDRRKGNSVIIPSFQRALETWKQRSNTVNKKFRVQRKHSTLKTELNRDTLKTRKKIHSKTQNAQYNQQHDQPKITINNTDSMKKTQTDSNFLRLNTTAPKNNARKIQIRSITQNNERQKDQLVKLDENYQNNAKNIEKQFNTNVNGLNSSQAQSWLNQVLTQYCTDQQFDIAIQNSALKKFRIDRNSLLSQGLNPQNLDRVYKSLFVYSIGFNNFLKNIAVGKNKKDNFTIRKTLWKVFAILLQYCGQGSFQATLAGIQRDKRRYAQYLKDQLQKKQYLIDYNDQINQQKNSKIFKEQKILKAMNQQLVIQKEILEQDLRQMELGFNHEVELRLKFETKINQLHGVYRELLQKHASLYQEHKRTTETIDGYKADLQLKSDQIAQRQIINTSLRSEISRLKEQIKVFEKQMKETRDSKKAITLELYEMKTQNHKLKEVQTGHAKNNEGIVMRLKTYQQQMDRMKRKQTNTLQQNVQSLHQIRNLQQTIEKQTIQINHLLQRQKNFNLGVTQIRAELVQLKRRKEQQRTQIQHNKAVIAAYQQEIQKLKNQTEVQQHINKQIMQVNQSLKKCLQQNKLLFEKLQTETAGDQAKYQILQKQFLAQAEQIKKLRLKVQTLEFQNSELKMKQISLISQVSSLTAKLTKDKEVNTKITQKKNKEKDISDIMIQRMIQQISALEDKVSEYKEGMNKAHKNFVQLKFEFGNVDLKYKQTLSVIQSQQKHIKDLKRNISQMVEEVAKVKLFESIKRKQLDFLEIQINRRIQRYEKQNQIIKSKMMQKKSYYHPLDFQDLYMRFHVLGEKHNQTVKNFQNYKIQKNDQIQKLETQLEQSITKFNSLSKGSKKDFETLLESLKVERITSEQTIQKFTQELKIKQKQIQKAVQQMNQIKTNRNILKKNFQEKVKQNKQMMIDLENCHDVITNLKENYARYDQKVREKDQTIKQLTDKVAILQIQKQHIQKALISIQINRQKSNQIPKNQQPQHIQSSRKTNRVLSANEMQQATQQQNDSKFQQQSNANAVHDQHFQDQQKFTKEITRNQFKKKYKRAFDYYHK